MVIGLNLLDNELVDRYIYYLTRYLPYDDKKRATDDVLKILNEKLNKNFTEEDLKIELEKLGNPYAFSNKYSNKGNFLLSGRNYEIFIAFIKILSISGLIAFLLFFFSYFARIKEIGFYEVIKTEILTIFSMSIITSVISEKIKTTKIMTSLMKSWSIKDLYRSKKTPSIYNKIFIGIYSVMFFVMIIYLKTGEFPNKTYNIMLFLFLLNLARDNLKMSEKTILSNLRYFIFFVDIFTIIALYIMLKFAVPSLMEIKIIMLFNLVDFLYLIYLIVKDYNLIGKKKEKRKK